MQNGEHIKLLFVIKIFVLSILVAVLLYSKTSLYRHHPEKRILAV